VAKGADIRKKDKNGFETSNSFGTVPALSEQRESNGLSKVQRNKEITQKGSLPAGRQASRKVPPTFFEIGGQEMLKRSKH